MQNFINGAKEGSEDVMYDNLQRFVAKRRIVTTYQKERKIHTIYSLANEKKSPVDPQDSPERQRTATQLRFDCKRDDRVNRITVKQFFQDTYGIDLKANDIPCVNTSSELKKPRYIPAELCRLLPGQVYGKKLSADQTTAMMKFAARFPAENAKRLVDGAERGMSLNPENEVLQVNMSGTFNVIGHIHVHQEHNLTQDVHRPLV